ncbi:hypothetical protein SLA2020_175050 [Shorea laevis]
MATKDLELYGFDLNIEAHPLSLLDLEYFVELIETDQALVVKNRVLQLEQLLKDQYLCPKDCSGDHGYQQGIKDNSLENLNSELL